MSLTVDQIVQQIVNQLRLLDPTVSAEVGTPERKIIEATAELIASQQVDFTVLQEQHNIDSMSGGRLDAYLSIFNFGRQQSTPSYGTVQFRRNTATTNAVTIPRGTQIVANIDDTVFPSLIFVTTETVVLEASALLVEATVQCTVAGTIGNIDANKVVGFGGLKSIVGITSVGNDQAMTGGSDGEDDAAYKVRFQRTFLRNISGTTDMFLALAVSANSVTKANVLGPISRYQEYVQIPVIDDAAQQTQGGGYDTTGTVYLHKRTSAKSTIPYSKSTYQTNYYLTDGTLDPATATFFRPGVDYIFNSPPIKADTGAVQTNDTPVTSPNVTFLNAYSTVNLSGNPSLSEGNVYLLEHAYMSLNSRNNYDYGILNAVDVFINGSKLASATSVEVVPGPANYLQNSTALRWTYQKTTPTKVINFRRKLDGKEATVGSMIQPLYWQPVLDLPEEIQIGSATYFKANYWNVADSTYYNLYDGVAYTRKAHYILVEEVNSNYGTIRCRNGIEWFLSGTNHIGGFAPTDDEGSNTGALIENVGGVEFTVDGYLYDQNVSDLQAIMEKSKQTTQDVLVHRAKVRYFTPIVTVMYTLGSTRAVVDASIVAALDSFFNNQYYGAAIQTSDILQAIHNVPGVDNVRFTNETGNRLEEVSASGDTLSGGPIYITNDFFIQDNELAASPSSGAVRITVRAQNTWTT
jgi:uncharacterized phage protein gp47/JayE